MAESGLCDTCSDFENTTHFFLKCAKTITARNKLITNMKKDNIPLDVKNLLSNPRAANHTLTFIRETNRYI